MLQPYAPTFEDSKRDHLIGIDSNFLLCANHMSIIRDDAQYIVTYINLIGLLTAWTCSRLDYALDLLTYQVENYYKERETL